MIREKVAPAVPGLLMVLVTIVAAGIDVRLFVQAIQAQNGRALVAAIVLMVVVILLLPGFAIVMPGEARVITLFGSYSGTINRPGLWWVNPFTLKKRISLRVRNFETAKLKVNDATGNPIEIGAIVVWKVVDTAEAMFEVDDYENYVKVQSESAVRGLASSYPYDSHASGERALSSHMNEIAADLLQHVQDRLLKAGVSVLEARIAHLAYAPEIAHAMLQRQQASAIVAARFRIVEGAVGMVENALEMLSQRNILVLDDERKAAMVSNLLVVLCGDRGTQPVVNTGTLYTG
jgi:regulator of protease activity HflC (stomatin/prohibitin superfamily)